MEERTSPEYLAKRNELGDYLNRLVCNLNTRGLASSAPSGFMAFLKKNHLGLIFRIHCN